jgi:hypothetical protein
MVASLGASQTCGGYAASKKEQAKSTERQPTPINPNDPRTRSAGEQSYANTKGKAAPDWYSESGFESQLRTSL